MFKWYYMLRCFAFGFPLLSLGQTPAQNFADGKNPITHQEFRTLIDSSDTFYYNGRYKESLKLNISLLQRASDLKDAYLMHLSYRNLAYDYLAITDTLMAQDSFIKSQKYAQETKNDTAIALTFMDLANMYSTVNKDYALANTYHERSIEGFKNIKDSTRLAKAYYNFALTAMDAEDYSKAYINIIKAKALHRHHEHEAFGIILNNLQGDYYLIKEDYPSANLYYRKVIKEATKADLPIELESAYLGYSQSLSKQQKFEDAYEMQVKYNEVLARNMKDLASVETEMMAAKFQVDEYKREMNAAEKEKELQVLLVANKSRWNNYLLTISGICLLMIGLLYFAYRNRKNLISELKVKNKEFKKAKEESERMSKAKTKFFSTVSHELRTPLYGVIGLSTLLMEDKSLSKHQKDLSLLKFSADYLLALINDVLQINKIDSKSLEEDTTTFNLQDLISTIAGSFEYMLIQNNNTFKLELDEKLPANVRGNAMHLAQILMNLIGNACKFTEGGTITVRVKEQARNNDSLDVCFSIEDNGLGIAKEKQGAIFDEFLQLGNEENYNYQGTGLGLPIVKKLLKQVNSEIVLESQLGKGSTFSFNLNFDRVSTAPQIEPTTLLDTGKLKDKRILVVEDNRINQIVTQKILEKHGVQCSLAQNGQEAVELTRNNAYDLILMDINMPVKDGMQATKEIRQFDKRIPIIALTAVEIEEVRFGIFEAGMNDIIVKPYDITKFKQTILKNIFLQRMQNELNPHLRAM